MYFEKDVFISAGLNQTEVAALLGVSRTTAYFWYKGGKVHPLIRTKIQKYTDAMRRAVEAKALPISMDRRDPETPIAVRIATVVAVLKNYI